MTAADLPLLGTKFHVPAARVGQVRRARLVERLERGASGKLTLISAPPGFGKTTLLAEWLAQDGGERDIAWLSLDAGDDHPATFWRYLTGAFARVRPAVAESSLAQIVEGPQLPDGETLATLLINAITADPREMLLVLDDYHVIESDVIGRGMTFLVDHAPPQLRLVIAGRADPALPLSRLRTRGELTEIRAADLRFTTQEAADFLNGAMRLGLRDEDVALLEARTEGWAGALQLAALSLQGREEASDFIRAFSGDDRYIVDYLVEEVLQRQAPDVRLFLLRTSILERLTAALCDGVTGGANGQAMLDVLERGNLFLLPLDDRRGWFRYHQLFSDVLRAHLRAEFAGETAELHRRASAWLHANGDIDAAIRHALAGGDTQGAAAMIELEAEPTVRRHHPGRLIDWLKPIPAEVTRAMPVLSTYYGHAMQGMGQMEASAARLDEAERALAGEPAAMMVFDQASFAILPALLAVGRGYLAMAAVDIEQTVTHASTALGLLPTDAHHWRGTSLALLGLAHWHNGDLGPAQDFHQQALACFQRSGDTGLTITSGYHDAELLKARGQLRAARRRLEATLEFVMERGVREARGAANLHLGLSEIACENNDLDEAERQLELAAALGIYPPRTPFRHCLARARLSEARGDLGAAEAWLIEAAGMQVRGAVPDHRPVAAWIAKLRAARGELDAAVTWARERGLPEGALTYAREPEQIAFARILLARAEPNDLATATQLLQALLGEAEGHGRMGTAIEIRILLAVALFTAGDEEAALEALAPALLRAEPEGYVRTFAGEGETLARLLGAAAKRGTAPEYCRRLLAAMAPGEEALPSRPATATDALSEREVEVLRLLATELSGPEIANTLFVSLNTLRTHSKNIYSKLQVSSRRAAVRRAADLGLL